MSRLTEMSSNEKRWIETLKNSEIVSRDFTADEAIITLKTTPLNDGKMPKLLPNKYSIQRLMLKSKGFERVSGRAVNKKKINEWRLKNA